MDIQFNRINYNVVPEHCYVHARGVILPNSFGIITMQKLELSGCDVFYGIELSKTFDGGKTFTTPVPSKTLTRTYYPDGKSLVASDSTPIYHRKTGKILLTGHTCMYNENNSLLAPPRPRHTAYAVYNEETGDFDPYKFLEMPPEEDGKYFSVGAGSTQILELPNGELLIPVYYRTYEAEISNKKCAHAVVLRCSFDGYDIRVLEVGSPLCLDVKGGLNEPSIASYSGKYFLCLRTRESGYVTSGIDGLHFGELKPICFDDGENIGNYNTQQHWLTGGGKLWLVYTRRAGNNDHVFRHRAPLFIAEFDPDNLCLIRKTEHIAVPERGARLGNFGCQSFNEEYGYIFAAEWMQSWYGSWDVCAEYGSDNSIFVSKVTY